MNRAARGALACGLLCGALLLTACGGGAPLSAAQARQEAQRLRSFLDGGPALPDGFSAKARPAWTPPFARLSRPCRAVLRAAAGHAPSAGVLAQAAVTYEGDQLGESVAVGLASYADGEAGTRLRELGESLAGCTRLASGAGSELRVRRLTGLTAEMGDDAVGGQARGRLNGYPYAMNVLLIRSGDTLVSLVHTGLATVDGRRTRRLARSFLK